MVVGKGEREVDLDWELDVKLLFGTFSFWPGTGFGIAIGFGYGMDWSWADNTLKPRWFVVFFTFC